MCTLWVNAKLGWLDNVSVVYLIFSLLLIGQQGLVHFFRHRPFRPIGLKISQTVRQRQGKLTIKMPLTHLKPNNFYHWSIVLNNGAKNNHLTISSQPNVALNARNILIFF
jgi:hypothetical protein